MSLVGSSIKDKKIRFLHGKLTVLGFPQVEAWRVGILQTAYELFKIVQ
jgi:hypothetical protein